MNSREVDDMAQYGNLTAHETAIRRVELQASMPETRKNLVKVSEAGRNAGRKGNDVVEIAQAHEPLKTLQKGVHQALEGGWRVA